MFRLKAAIILLSMSLLTGCSGIQSTSTVLAQNNTSVDATYDISSLLPEDTAVVENTVDENQSIQSTQ
ncbi:MAG: hypothetical protein J6I76_12515 [Oribacterium sp.]|nr:hypothetical protein [Oribacterium sp.]